jgi:F420-non-reducing hydrogenase iron-sulfur subunit
VNYLHDLLDQVGLKGERVKMANLSAAMGARFAEIATDMVERIRELGPNPLRENHELGGKL